MLDPIGRGIFGERQGRRHRWSEDDVIDRSFRPNRNWNDNEEAERLRERRLRKKVLRAQADREVRHAKKDQVDYQTRTDREDRLEMLRERRERARKEGGRPSP